MPRRHQDVCAMSDKGVSRINVMQSVFLLRSPGLKSPLFTSVFFRIVIQFIHCFTGWPTEINSEKRLDYKDSTQ